MRLLCTLSLLATAAHAAEYPYLPPIESGRLRCGDVPTGWRELEFDDAPWLAAAEPIAARDASPLDAGIPACAALRFRRRFDVGPEAARLATITLRARYQDGLVAWLNGVEIARRRYVGGPLATEPHGPEPERFVVRVQPGLLRPTGNVLAVEVHPARPGGNPTAELALDGADTLRILRGPYLQRMLDGEGWLRLETDLPSHASIRYSPAGASGSEREVIDPEVGTRHALHLTHLAAGTAYRYELSVSAEGFGAQSMEASFHTAPTVGHPLRFAVFGDVRSGHDVHDQIARAVAAEDPDLVLMTGDLVDRGTDEGDWERFFEVAAPLLRQVAIYPAPGNHEYFRHGKGVERFLELFPRPVKTSFWSFDVAGVHFVCLDSEAFKDPEQLAWLERDLKAARQRKVRAIFAYDHDGPWSSALHGDNAVAIRDYAPVLDRYRVSMVFAGHDHDYERGRVGTLDYLVTGGGGAELRTPRCGIPGKKACLPRVHAFVNEHHYVMVEVLRDRVRICPKRPDGTLLEECPTFPIRK